MADILPLSTNGWHPPSLALASSLSRAGILPLTLASSLSRAGILPLSTNGCHPSSFDKRLPSIFDNSVVLPLADGLPCLDEQLPPSFDERLPPSLDKQFLPLADVLTPPSTNCLPLPSANSLLPASTHSLIPQQMLSSRVSGGLAMSKYYCHS